MEKRFEVAKVARLIHAIRAEFEAKEVTQTVFLENWGYAERNDKSEYEETLVENVEREIRTQVGKIPEAEYLIERFGELVELMQ